jgi:hypothetical protein
MSFSLSVFSFYPSFSWDSMDKRTRAPGLFQWDSIVFEHNLLEKWGNPSRTLNKSDVGWVPWREHYSVLQCCGAAVKQGVNPKSKALNTKQYLNPNR